MMGVAPLVCVLLLAACGGGGGGAAPGAESLSGASRTSEVPQVDQFVALARSADCARTTNRLYLIDQKMVFWRRADLGCFDAAYAHHLYGATPQMLLCSSNDSIAGPMIRCTDAQYRSLFDTILNNLDKGDLGLGSAHKVEAIAIG
jgi:hypothetical protein